MAGGKTSPVQTRNRTDKVSNKGKNGSKTSSTSTPSRSNSLCCGDTFELLEKKLLEHIVVVIRERFEEIQEFIATKITNEFKILRDTCDRQRVEIISLKNSLEQLHRQQRLNDVIITGIPFTQNEEPFEIAKSVASAVGLSLPVQTIAFRSKNAGSRSGPVIVKLPTAYDRRALLQSYRRSGPIKLQQVSNKFSSNINVGVYESLTKNNYVLLREALILRRNKLLHSVVTRNGLVYVRESGEGSWRCISSCEILDQFRIGEVAVARSSSAAVLDDSIVIQPIQT